jgi:hypothetical protein
MKKAFLTIFALCLCLLFACAVDAPDYTNEKVSPSVPESQEPPTQNNDTVNPAPLPNDPTDNKPTVPVTPDTIDPNHSDIVPATPDTIKPDAPKPLTKSYVAHNTVSGDDINSSKAWIDTLGGFPGFTITAQYDEVNDCYLLGDGMGAYQLIEKVEFSPSHIKVYFVSGVIMHKYMTNIPDYIAINSSQIKVTSPDGYEYTSTVYTYTYSGKGKLDTSSEQVTLTFPIGAEITERVQDIFISCGKVD